MDIHRYTIQSRSELGSKSYIFMKMKKWFHSLYFHEIDKIIPFTNMSQYILSAEIFSDWKIESLLPNLVRKSMYGKKLTANLPYKYSPL